MTKKKNFRDIDSLDRRILRVLQREGRITNAALADKIGLSAPACHARVKAMEVDGIIDRYVAILDPKSVGRPQTVFVRISLCSQSKKVLAAFENAIAVSNHIQQCHLMSGDDDYLLQVIVKDASEFEDIHHSFLTCLPGVAKVSSSFAMRTVRKATEILLI